MLLAALTSAFSCRQHQGSNANGKMKAQTNTGDNMNTHTKDDVNIVGSPSPKMMSSEPGAGDKDVTIDISDDPANPGRCTIADPGPVTL